MHAQYDRSLDSKRILNAGSATIGFLETWLCEFIAIEQGGMLQNLVLLTRALGLRGFLHFAAHPFIWFQTLGFRKQESYSDEAIAFASALRLLSG